MEKTLEKILMPLFRAIAAPGIGNPHTPHENELLISGAKPTAIIGDKDITEELQLHIDSGNLVEIDDAEFEFTYSIYCRKEEAEKVQLAANILENTWCAGKGASLEEAEILNDVFQVVDKNSLSSQFNQESYSHHVVNSVMAPGGSGDFVMAMLTNGHNDEIQSFLDGNRPILNIFHSSSKSEDGSVGSLVHPELQDALNSDAFTSISISKKELIKVLAQKDKVEDGKELFSRYYNNESGYKPILEDKAWEERIGQLLGYTENDIAWRNGDKYQHPFIHSLMEKTAAIRREARKIVMLHDASSDRQKPS